MTRTPEQIEHLKLWVAALRSGEYRQGRKRLRINHRDGDRFCCLGVACDVMRKVGIGYWDGDTFQDSLVSTAYLPVESMDFYGLADQSPVTSRGALTLLNDQGILFSEIADIIEREFIESHVTQEESK